MDLFSLVTSKAIAESSGSSGGGAALNIAYGDTAPTDKSKLWIKANEPQSIVFGSDFDGVESVENLNIPLTNNNTNRTEMACAKVGKKIYMFGGYLNGKACNLIQVFDTETQQLTTLDKTLDAATTRIVCAAVEKKIYLFGGYTTANIDSIYIFDTETNDLTPHSEKLASTGYFTCGVAVGEKIYLNGFSTDSQYPSTAIYIFDTTTGKMSTASNTWKSRAQGAYCAAVGDKIYLFGAYYYGGTSSYYSYNTIQEYDIKTDTTRLLDEVLPHKYSNISCATIGTKVYLFGGYMQEYGVGKNKVSSIVVFDPTIEKATLLETGLPNSIDLLRAIPFGNEVYLLGDTNSKSILRFSLTHDLTQNNIEVITAYKNFFNIINSNSMKVEIGVDSVLIGNEENHAKVCEAYLHNGTDWQQI